MANIKSAEKRNRQTQRLRAANRSVKTRMRTEVRKLRADMELGNAKEVAASMPATASIIDRTAKKGVIHRNTAARMKSRLAKAATKASA